MVGGDTNSNSNNNNSNILQENSVTRGLASVFKIIDGPVTFFRERIVEPLRARNPQTYYHRKFNRVPTVDQCDVDDLVCIYEATEQMYRDRQVDKQITNILQDRLRDCYGREGSFDAAFKCQELQKDLDLALTNYYIKYGDLSSSANAIDVYMKQKHRLIWQRRNPDKDIFGYDESAKKQKAQEEAMSRVHDKDRF